MPRSSVGRTPSAGRSLVTVLVVVLAACRGGDEPAEQANAGGHEPAEQADAGGDGSGGAFHLGRAGFENGCTVLSQDQVAEATGFTVLEARDAVGCDYVIEGVDDAVAAAGESVIGWEPHQKESFANQRQNAPEMDSDVRIEAVAGIGGDAFWLGREGFRGGEFWVELDQLSFRVVNQFAHHQYTGEIREPMEALARVLAPALSGIDIDAAG